VDGACQRHKQVTTVNLQQQATAAAASAQVRELKNPVLMPMHHTPQM
jgi:hypothetical protein